MAGFWLRCSEDSERSGGTTVVKQATMVGGDGLIVADLELEEVAEFVIVSAEASGRTATLEPSHTLYAAFHVPVILLKSVILVDAEPMHDAPNERGADYTRVGSPSSNTSRSQAGAKSG
jgi:hypothetical protein